ncbi:unnamed protein product [Trichogramma brassicae]|uniref:Uncharacterized protein n=1 Tax=Trichogramma brassicae TaxID=86971 RepID=A0A6H5IDB1_9HYME|nr:unnamed protein product [Trichogramma brassicae]
MRRLSDYLVHAHAQANYLKNGIFSNFKIVFFHNLTVASSCQLTRGTQGNPLQNEKSTKRPRMMRPLGRMHQPRTQHQGIWFAQRHCFLAQWRFF